MRSTLLRFYLGIVLVVLLLFFSLNQLYSWVYQRDDIADAAQSMLLHVNEYTSQHRLSCRISDTDDCLDALFVTYPSGMWQPQPGFYYAIEVMRDASGHASMCSEVAGGELLCLSQLNLPDGTDFSIDLAHVFILLLLLCMFWLSRNVFRDVETLRQSALQEIKLGHLPAFRLSAKSYLQPLARSLSRMNQRITDLNSLQREMADTVCHDIKTPLARLRFIMLSIEAQISPAHYAQVHRNLLEIEENVYDYLRLAQQDFRADLQLSQLDLPQLVQELIDKFAANSEHQLALLPGPMLMIQADQKLLQRALSNLLSNALRYCRDKVWIELSIQGTDILIDICDDGSGWQQPPVKESSAAYPANLINPISPAASSTNSEHTDGVSHHGIGLAIVSRVAHQHGGEFIRLDRPEGGAIARLRLPVGSDSVSETATNINTAADQSW
ncbi:hypothetical protein A5320_14200 [Rheinheimera sp. SA_1]|uniref:sensor histidine kinase n=1 Tax=Rheinheimera sp. SA_1 TaxID=1827365 RepID=UPI000802354C|nr:ATP-binding protein [Rheinheimera sp. SA_1]OBP14861.1 hypothetical protein A5320_14200 [Rheinheimera sp. SA_1]